MESYVDITLRNQHVNNNNKIFWLEIKYKLKRNMNRIHEFKTDFKKS